MRYFYDVCYSEDDDNFFGQVCTEDNVDVYDTPCFGQKAEVISDIKQHFTWAELLSDFT